MINTGSRPSVPVGTKFDVTYRDGYKRDRECFDQDWLWFIDNEDTDIVEYEIVN